jgi:mannose-6-phosphate isomerase-like protein (cupin superfamily)
VHRNEDEAFWVLDGSVTFEVGETKVEAGPSDYAFGPRNVPTKARPTP